MKYIHFRVLFDIILTPWKDLMMVSDYQKYLLKMMIWLCLCLWCGGGYKFCSLEKENDFSINRYSSENPIENYTHLFLVLSVVKFFAFFEKLWGMVFLINSSDIIFFYHLDINKGNSTFYFYFVHYNFFYFLFWNVDFLKIYESYI